MTSLSRKQVPSMPLAGGASLRRLVTRRGEQLRDRHHDVGDGAGSRVVAANRYLRLWVAPGGFTGDAHGLEDVDVDTGSSSHDVLDQCRCRHRTGSQSTAHLKTITAAPGASRR